VTTQASRRLTVLRGEYHVAGEGVVLTTILGSCVAACIRDPLVRAGGMNHFLLPGAATLGQDEATSLVYGMPRAAFEAGAVERQLPLARIAGHILALTRLHSNGANHVVRTTS
jgi:chemotaxis receptor (MCP) glutamine deamidase CheD